MSKISKRTKLVDSKIDREKLHTINEAIDLLKSVKATKFDETVELALRLGVDPRKADRMIRRTPKEFKNVTSSSSREAGNPA